MIEALNAEKKIDVDFFGGKKPSLSIGFVAARTWETVEASDFEGAEVILVSVGGTNLADVGAELKKYVTRNTKIIVCENASSPAKKLGAAIGIDGGPHKQWSMWFNSKQREEPYQVLTSRA